MILAPDHEICGATNTDQAWIDDTIERGVAGLGWERPKPRPSELPCHVVDGKAVPVPLPPEKPSKPSRFRLKLWPT